MFWKFLDDMNFIARCKKYNIGIWQCPNFLFLVMGFLNIAVMFATYAVSQRYYSDTVTIIAVSSIAATILIIGSFVIRGVERIAEANIMKSEFISIISHQLCSPLSAIKWNLEILETEGDGDSLFSEKQRMFLDNIKKANSTMLKLVNDLMELIRIDQGSSVIENKEINLADLAKDVMKYLDRVRAAKNVSLILDAKENIPLVFADPKKIKIIMENLVGNAIKYSNEGGTVEIKVYPEGQKVFFAVEDHGIGIPKYQHSKVFQKFFRSNNTSRYRTDGVGIGLYLVKSILKYFNGKIWFESEEGKGSTFYVSLPAYNK
jgi:signal transduction histidine kinase